MGEYRIDLADCQRRLLGGWRHSLQRLPAHPGTPLAQTARQVGDDDLDVVIETPLEARPR